jgi:hypothetical protein
MATGDDEQLLVPRGIKKDTWRITAARLKLALKYGIEGPWQPPNWSVAFDAYALTPTPMHRLPNLVDFAVTQLMNSRAETRDLQRLSRWLREEENIRQLEAVRNALSIALRRPA